MEISTLKAFLHIAEGATFREAAEYENMSQAAISRAINALEKELGFTLFYREHRTVRLTEAGDIFYHGISELFPTLEHALSTVQLYSHMHSITCCVIPYCSSYDMKEISHHYSETNPGKQIHLIEAPNFNQIAFDFEHGQLDFIIMHQPFTGPYPYDSIELVKEDSLVAVLPPRHPLSRRSSIHLRDLSEELILTDNYMDSVIKDLCYSTGCTLQTRIVPPDSSGPMESILRCVSHGHGINICFESNLSAYRLDRVSIRKIRNLPPSPIVLIYPKGKILNATSRSYLQYLSETFEDLQRRGGFF